MAGKKKMNKGVIAAICAVVIAAIAAVVTVVVINVTKPADIVGKYKLYATVDEEGNENTQEAEIVKAFGGKYELEFRADGTGTFVMGIDSSLWGAFGVTDDNAVMTIDFTYADGKFKGTDSDGDEAAGEYEYKDGAVILKFGDEKNKFVKEEQ